MRAQRFSLRARVLTKLAFRATNTFKKLPPLKPSTRALVKICEDEQNFEGPFLTPIIIIREIKHGVIRANGKPELTFHFVTLIPHKNREKSHVYDKNKTTYFRVRTPNGWLQKLNFCCSRGKNVMPNLLPHLPCFFLATISIELRHFVLLLLLPRLLQVCNMRPWGVESVGDWHRATSGSWCLWLS